MEPNGWAEWRKAIWSKMESTEEQLNILRNKDLPRIREEIASLKAKSMIWGSISAGLVYTIFKMAF